MATLPLNGVSSPRNHRSAARIRRAAIALAMGMLLLVAIPWVWAAAQPDPVGQTVISIGSPAIDARAAGVAAPASTPERLRVPALGVDAAVVPVGVDRQGLMEIPADVGIVGWYQHGPVPGAPSGSAVLAGHVNDMEQGAGVFARLGDLVPGDRFTVTDAAGRDHGFTVRAGEEWPKRETPMDRLFDRAGAARLVLITCGGPYDWATNEFADNLAITAIPDNVR